MDWIKITRDDGTVEYVHPNAEEINRIAKDNLVNHPRDPLSDSAIQEINQTLYQGARQNEYPPLAEQLDKLFHDIENGTLDQNGEFFTTLKSVKDSNPKPE